MMEVMLALAMMMVVVVVKEVSVSFGDRSGGGGEVDDQCGSSRVCDGCDAQEMVIRSVVLVLVLLVVKQVVDEDGVSGDRSGD